MPSEDDQPDATVHQANEAGRDSYGAARDMTIVNNYYQSPPASGQGMAVGAPRDALAADQSGTLPGSASEAAATDAEARSAPRAPGARVPRLTAMRQRARQPAAHARQFRCRYLSAVTMRAAGAAAIVAAIITAAVVSGHVPIPGHRPGAAISDPESGLSYAKLPSPWQSGGCPSSVQENYPGVTWTAGESAVAGKVNGRTPWSGVACSGPSSRATSMPGRQA